MKLRFAALAFINFFRLSCVKLFHNSCFKYAKLQLIALGTVIQFKKGGRLLLQGRLHTEAGVYISVGGDLSIGNRVYINRGSLIVCRSKISIGDGTTVGPNVMIYDHDHSIVEEGSLVTKPIELGKNVWIGAGCIILKGVKVGDNSIVAAGTIVTKNVPAHSLIMSKNEVILKELQ